MERLYRRVFKSIYGDSLFNTNLFYFNGNMGRMNIITSPACLWIPKAGGKRDNALNLNWYRNAHFHKLNKAKKMYKAIMRESIIDLPKYNKITLHYQYFLHQKCDMGNVHSIVEKFFLDALVEFGKIPDDNCEIVSSDSKEFFGYDRENPRCIIEIREVT